MIGDSPSLNIIHRCHPSSLTLAFNPQRLSRLPVVRHQRFHGQTSQELAFAATYWAQPEVGRAGTALVKVIAVNQSQWLVFIVTMVDNDSN